MTYRHHYFAYGSNMDPAQMRGRAPGARSPQRARLDGWRLEFRGVADIVEDDRSRTDGVLWEVTKSDLARLDAYEGYPVLYDRKLVVVRTDGGSELATVYVMAAADGLAPPSPRYLDGILAGARAHGIGTRHIRRALARVHRSLRAEGITRVRLHPNGKRYRPVPPKVKRQRRPAPSPARHATDGMSPATRAELGLDRLENEGRLRLDWEWEDDIPVIRGYRVG